MENVTISMDRTGPGEVAVTVLADGQPASPEQVPQITPWLAQFLPQALPILVAILEPTADGREVYHLNPGKADRPRLLVVEAS